MQTLSGKSALSALTVRRCRGILNKRGDYVKQLWHGFQRLCAEQAWLVVFWIFCLFIFIDSLHTGADAVRPMLMSLLMLIGIPLAAYFYGRQKASYGVPSETVLTEPSPVVMTVESLERDTVSFRFMPYAGAPNGTGVRAQAADPGQVDRICVTFENRTGAPIKTDTSFLLERQFGLKWYQVAAKGEAPPWEAVELPEGASEPVFLLVFWQYPYLPQGAYRVVKQLQTVQGPVTVAAVFTVDKYHNK